MEDPAQLDKKVYAATTASAISMRELLEYFRQHGGSMRVSDLHLKAGSPPVYRVDGRLVFLKGAPLDAPTIRELVLFGPANAGRREYRCVAVLADNREHPWPSIARRTKPNALTTPYQCTERQR